MFNRLAWLAAFIILLVIIAYYFIPDFSRNVVPLLKGLRYEWVLLALVATLAHFFAEVARWWVYLRKTNAHGAGLFGSLLSIFSLTALVTYLLPAKLGIPLRVYLLTSRLRVRLTTVTTYLVLDGVMAYGLWLLLALVLYSLYGGAIHLKHANVFAIAATCALALGFLFRRRLRMIQKKLQDQLAHVSSTGLLLAVAILLLDIIGYVVRHAAILEAMSVELSLSLTAFVTIASIAAGFISMLPMGLGAYDVTLVFLLTNAGVPLDSAVMVPLLNRGANMIVSLILGVPGSYVTGESLSSLRAKYREKSKKIEA